MTAHYENVKKDKFLEDLAEKESVLFLYDEVGTIQGFTTFMLMETQVDGHGIQALYSGDTIIDKAFWGQRELFRVFGSLFRQFLEQRQEPIYWFLMTKGIRTYMLLPLFFENFYPSCMSVIPQEYQALKDRLARQKFGKFYLKERGIVRVEPKADRLQCELACIPEHKLKNPHVRFFVEQNPGYTDGDELVCITQISNANLTAIGKRFAKL
ncbi:MAG: hypothetical protein GY801_16840 [bacterium]|nr:hypothetical protein [bacterium]